jgi:hypothetical protein
MAFRSTLIESTLSRTASVVTVEGVSPPSDSTSEAMPARASQTWFCAFSSSDSPQPLTASAVRTITASATNWVLLAVP